MTPFPDIPGLTPSENDTVSDLLNTLHTKRPRNLLRQRYIDAKQTVRNLGIAIPPGMQLVEAVLGWPAKAINLLERRIHFDGLVMAGVADPFGLDGVLADNQIAVEAAMAHTAALKYGLGLLFVHRGDPASGEPEVIITPRSALTSSALWDFRRRRIRAALSVTENGDGGSPNAFLVYFPDKVVDTALLSDGRIRAQVMPHRLARVPVAPLRYNPDTDDRPLGRSKLSRPMMALTDHGARTLLRTEVSAEFYNAPQRYALGADEAAFQKKDGTLRTGWEITLGKMLALPMNEDGEMPQVGQFPQQSMQPNLDELRMVATLYAGEANIPVSSLGIIHDNPSSDAAMHTAYLDLIQDAERCHTTFGAGWVEAGKLAVMVRDNLTELPEEARGLSAKFRDASTPTRSAATQAVVEQVREGILPADSDVTLEQLGYDATTIARVKADRRRAEASGRLTMLAQAAQAIRAQNGPQVAIPATEEEDPTDG